MQITGLGATIKRMDDRKRPTIFYGWFLLAAAFLIVATGYSMRYSFSVFYDDLLDEFGWSRASTSLAFSISLLVYGISSPIGGSLVDRLGPRKVLVFAGCILSTGLLAMSQMNALWYLYIVFGVVMAIGVNSAGFATQYAYMPNWFVLRRGLAFGVVAAGTGAAGNRITGPG